MRLQHASFEDTTVSHSSQSSGSVPGSHPGIAPRGATAGFVGKTSWLAWPALLATGLATNPLWAQDDATTPADTFDPAPETPVAEPATASEPQANAPVPEPAPTAVPASSAECRPACRQGFTCIDGACVSACNPPCGPGQLCLDSGECAAGAPAASSAAMEAQQWEEEQRRWEEEAQKAYEARLAHREHSRLSLGVAGMILPPALEGPTVEDWLGVAALAQIGFRANFPAVGGIQIKAGPGVAIYGADELTEQREMGLDDTETVDSVTAVILGVSVNPYFGPFGRFYFGPELWIAHWDVASERLEATEITYSGGSYSSVTTERMVPDHASGLTYGLGILFGVLPGSLEQFNLWGGIRVGSRKQHALADVSPYEFTTERHVWVSLIGGIDFDVASF